MRLKHSFERVAALVALMLLTPMLVVIAWLIYLDSGGPVVFKQRRLGYLGKEFEIYKFRTMVNQKVTRIGRFLRNSSLDELLNLYNVVKGDMSFVGPRPMPGSEIDVCDRHRIKPGMTGYAQVHGLRGHTSLQRRLEYDLYYVKNWSLVLDFIILCKTIFAVIKYREQGK